MAQQLVHMVTQLFLPVQFMATYRPLLDFIIETPMSELAPNLQVENKEYDLQLTTFFFENQKEFSSRFLDVKQFNKHPESMTSNPEDDPRAIWGKDAIRCIIDESGEILQALPWKHWKEYENWEAPYDYIQEEVIDSFHFVINLGINLGLDPSDIGPIEKHYDETRESLNTELRERGLDSVHRLDDESKAFLSAEKLSDLQDELIKLRLTLPTRNNSEWYPNYNEITASHNQIMKRFVEQSLIWDIDENSLLEAYLRKHEKNIMRQVNGYTWNAERDVHYT